MIDAERERMFIEYNEILENQKAAFMEKWKLKIDDKGKADDFERYRTVGTGAFGRVMLVKHKLTNTYYAMKILEKARLVKTKQVDHTRNEKRILQCVDFPFVVFMAFCFKARVENRNSNVINLSNLINTQKNLFLKQEINFTKKLHSLRVI